MKRFSSLLLAAFLIFSTILPVTAANGKVSYDGIARDFIFADGSDESVTDLFPDFKDLMPGDSVTQKITVKNDASKNVKVKIYLRSLGALEESVDLLSQLHLRVKTSDNNEMAYMFDAQANETAQLSDWVCLGTLYSGGEVNLDVILDIPTSVGNDAQNAVGFIDWEFMVEEYPTDPDDPKPPQTGDQLTQWLWIILIVAAVLLIVIYLISRDKNKRGDR